MFNTNRLTKKELRDQICAFAKAVGVKKVIFNSSAKYLSGSYNAYTNIIYLSLNQTRKQMLNTLFHELAHYESVKTKKWIKYHFNLYKTSNYERWFFIENKIDQLGKKLWKRYVNKSKWGNYKFFYLKRNKTQMTNFLNQFNDKSI
jgi:hypothetical protein